MTQAEMKLTRAEMEATRAEMKATQAGLTHGELPQGELPQGESNPARAEMSATQGELKSFADFWPHYLAEHSRAGTRRLHAAGTLASTALAVALVASGRWRWLPLALATGYAAAWTGHLLIEHNRPATFKHPLWSFAADYKMVALMLAGKMKG